MTHIRTWVGCPLAREVVSAGCVEIKQKLRVLGACAVHISSRTTGANKVYRISDFKPVAFEAPTSKGRCVRFTASVEPELAFDAYDAATGGALGEIYVWDAHPVRAERQRMLAAHE